MLWACTPDQKTYPAPQPFPTPSIPASLGFPPLQWPAANPLTIEGVALGRRLFYDKGLSADYSISCASCHHPGQAFSDTLGYSLGVGGAVGNRNGMPLFNLLWSNRFFWDGRAATLQEQVVQPIQDPVEMHLPLNQALDRLNQNPTYREGFGKAFGQAEATTDRVQKALEQFLLSLISYRSRFDQWRTGQATFTASEQRGFDLFMREYAAPGSGRPAGADCFHCHGNSLFTTRTFENNGLDSVLKTGFQQVTGSTGDRGKFKVPSLRNVALTAPYMHDGRFATLEEVVAHYDHGVVQSATLNANLRVQNGSLGLSVQDRADLVAFLGTLTDSAFVRDPAIGPP